MKLQKYPIVAIAVACVISLISARPAVALPAFAKAFKESYFKPSDDDDFKKAIRKANCNICHVKGEKKDVNNAYGDSLAELIEGDAKDRWDAAKKVGDDEGKAELAKMVAELNDAFTKVAGMKTEDGESTYGELLESGKLPVPVSNDKEEGN